MASYNYKTTAKNTMKRKYTGMRKKLRPVSSKSPRKPKPARRRKY